MDFNKLIRSAQTSRFGLWKLNFLLKRVIPFNRPHGIKIIDLTANRVEVLLPMNNANLNHLKGLHACGLATAAEFSSGFLLLSRLGIENYRLIMQSLEVEYFYQGKTDARAIYELSDEELEEGIVHPLRSQEKVNFECKVELRDKLGNHLCTVKSNWQIKSWEKVSFK